MPSRRLIASLAGVAAFAVLGTNVAHAAGGVTLGADSVAVASCTNAGVSADFELAGQSVRAITVADLPESCLGRTVTVTVTRSTGSDVSASASVTAASARLPLSTAVDAGDVTALGVLITG